MFVLMQEPSVGDPANSDHSFSTIGLRSLYPDWGFASCDEFGNVDNWIEEESYQDDGDMVKGFAFLDDESRKAFKGKTHEWQGIWFAITQFKGSKEKYSPSHKLTMSGRLALP